MISGLTARWNHFSLPGTPKVFYRGSLISRDMSPSALIMCAEKLSRKNILLRVPVNESESKWPGLGFQKGRKLLGSVGCIWKDQTMLLKL